MLVSLNSLVAAVVSFMKCVNFAQLAVLEVDFHFWIYGMCLFFFALAFSIQPITFM
jgi:hypothetical protein